MFILTLLPGVLHAQTYADKSYYLVDSLDLDVISKEDRLLIDSCLKVYHRVKGDTSRINAINVIVEESWDSNVWPKYNQWIYSFVRKKLKTSNSPTTDIFYKKYLAIALNNLAYLQGRKGDLTKALEYHHRCLKVGKEIGDKQGMGQSYSNIAYIYHDLGDIAKALDYYHKSLRIHEEIGYKKGEAMALNNLGQIYQGQGDTANALEYYYRSLKIYEGQGNKKSVAALLNNIGYVYNNQGNTEKGREYYYKSLKIKEEIQDKEGIAAALNNLGSTYDTQGNIIKALECYNKSLKLYEELGNKEGIAVCLNNIASIEIEKAEKGKIVALKSAKENMQRALKLAHEIGSPARISTFSLQLSKIYKIEKNYNEALEMYELHIQMRDSIKNEETQKAVIQQQAKYEYEKEKEITEVKHQKELEKQNAIAAEEQDKQRIIIYAIGGGLLLILVFSIFIYRRLQITRKQKLIIEEQGHELSEANEELNQTNEELASQRDAIEQQRLELVKKNEHITASINYAKRIQDALLKNEEHANPHMPQHFILFKPKDIVSGDFYWALEKQGHLYLAAADCTGHGVPGAFLTMLGTSFLNEINSTSELRAPAEILDILRGRIVKELSQTGAEGESKDGMDISLLRLNLKTNEVQWSGANNPIYIIPNGSKVVEVTKGDREPIGYTKDMTPFTNHEFKLEKGDTIYLFSDGYADQFGGPNGKKFSYRKLRNLFVEISQEPMDEQKSILDVTFEDWLAQGDDEQIDDVCVIGIKV